MVDKATLGVIILSLICIQAKGDSPVATTVQNNPLVAMAENYLKVKDINISYEAMLTTELSPAAIEHYKKLNVAVPTKGQIQVNFCADKVGFCLEVSSAGANRGPNILSYDGTHYAAYDELRKVLIVSKERPKVFPQAWNFNSLLLLPGLLAKNHNSYDGIDCLWSDINDPSFWATVTGTVFSTTEGGQLRGLLNGKRITMTLADKSPLGIGDIENFREANDFPENSKPGTASTYPTLKYTIDKIGECTFAENGTKISFFYPQKATLQEFSPTTGHLLLTTTHEIAKITLNDPNFDESKFTQDAAAADYIHDEDAGKWITPPR